MQVLSDEPFLFFQDPPDWSWISFAEAGRQIASWQHRLADLAPLTRVGILSSPSVACLLADVAARSLGLMALPLAAATGDVTGDEGVVDLVIDPGAGAGDWGAGMEVPPAIEGDPESAQREVGGCMVTRVEGRRGGHSLLTAGDVELAVQRLGRMIGDRERREIVVHGRCLGERGERLMLEWAMRTAASIVVAPTPESSALSAFWARPTVLHGSSSVLSEYASMFRAGERGERGLAARFRRLRQVIVFDGQSLDAPTGDFFRSLGAEVVVFDGPGDEFPGR